MISRRPDIRFDPRVLAADPARRERVLPVLEAALQAVDPGEAVRRFLHGEGNPLRVGDRRFVAPRCYDRRGQHPAQTPIGSSARTTLSSRSSFDLFGSSHLPPHV
jgi:hypothetical protein